MNFIIRRDLAALRFVRASCRLPHVNYNAGGAGFTLSTAIAKCRSEHIERSFEITQLRPAGIIPVGIAAHPESSEAISKAYWEAIEDFNIRRLVNELRVEGMPVWNAEKFKWWIARLAPRGWFSVIVTEINGTPLVVSSAGPSLFSTLLKVWEEYRNPIFFNVDSKSLETYSRASKLLGPKNTRALSFTRSFLALKIPELSDFEIHSQEQLGHHIAYLTPHNIEGKTK